MRVAVQHPTVFCCPFNTPFVITPKNNFRTLWSRLRQKSGRKCGRKVKGKRQRFKVELPKPSEQNNLTGQSKVHIDNGKGLECRFFLITTFEP